MCRKSDAETTDTHQLVSINGQWHNYLPLEYYKGNKGNFTEEERQQWRKEKLAREQEQRRVEELKQSKLLPIQDRTKKLSILLEKLSLKPKHHQELLRRGLSQEQIIAGSYNTISYNQEISGCDGLPGFTGGRYVGKTGYICPIKDIDGNWVGFQVKTNSDSQKYVWTTHYDDKIQVQAKVKEFNEYPIQVINKYQSTVGLCEGVLKPYIAATRHDISILGYAGGMFSPKTLEYTLQKLNPARVVIYPDAGFLPNNHVYSFILKYADCIANLGYEVLFADWGHWATKDHYDIDEISTIEGIKYRSIEEVCAAKKNIDAYIANNLESSSFYLDGLIGIYKGFINTTKTKFKKHRKIKAPNGVSGFQPYQRNQELPNKISYNSANAVDLYHDLIRQGKIVLDRSATGTGKSYTAAHVDPAYLTTDPNDPNSPKILYCTTSSRNLTEAKFQEKGYKELPVKNVGYSLDHDRLTGTGDPFRIELNNKYPEKTPGNCYLAKTDNSLRKIHSDLSTCTKCVHAWDCRNSEESTTSDGKAIGYLKQRRKIESENKLILNPNSLSNSFVDKYKALIIDEYSQSIAFTKSIEVSSDDVLRLQAAIINSRKTPFFEILPFLLNLSEVLAQDDTNLYGKSTIDILPLFDDTLDYEHLIKLAGNIEIFLENQNSDLSNKYRIKEQDLEAKLHKIWLVSLLTIIKAVKTKASLILQDHTLTIITRNDDLLAAILKAHGIIFQDATGSVQDLALKFNIPIENIIEICHEDSLVPQNLEVIQLKGMGKLGNNRRQSAQNKVNKLKELLYATFGHDQVGVIDYKRYGSNEDMVHFADGRGSNRFQDKKAVAIMGVPYANIGASLADLECFTGERLTLASEQLQDYIDGLFCAEIIQEIGRTRANRREDEVKVYIAGEADLSFLETMGYRFRVEDAIKLDIELGDRGQRARFGIFNAVNNLVNQGISIIDITQEALAESVELSRTRISQIAQDFGGFKQFKKILVALCCRGQKAIIDAVGGLTEEEVFLANSYLPELFQLSWSEIAEDVKTLASTYGSDRFKAMLAAVPLEVAAKFFIRVFDSLPAINRRELLVLYDGLLN